MSMFLKGKGKLIYKDNSYKIGNWSNDLMEGEFSIYSNKGLIIKTENWSKGQLL